MDRRHTDPAKPRSGSTESSTSSVTEYVNEVFEASELELSKVVSVNVTNDLQYVKNPMNKTPDTEDTVKTKTPLQIFADSSSSENGIGKPVSILNIRKMYVASVVVLLFAVCMGMTATYTATATLDMKKPHSSIDPNDDEVTWIGSLMAIGALVGGSTGVSGKNMFLLVTVILSLTLATLIEMEEDVPDLEIPKDGVSSLRQMLIQNMLHQKDFEDSVQRVREAGPKRAHARRFDQMPPGFVGVRGKKSEKIKIKEPVPGFLGVRGKKSYHLSLLSNEGIRSTIASNHHANSIDRCIRNELAKYKNVE